MANRLGQFDQLRSVAALAVIGIHVSANYAAGFQPAYIINQMVRFSVPLFVILSGLLLYRSSEHEFSLPDFWKKRGQRILWPYLIWSAIYFLYDIAVQGVPGAGSMVIRVIGGHLLRGSAFYHLYFMVVIIQLYVLFPLLREGIRKNPFFLLMTSLLITLVMQSLLYLHALNIIILPAGPGDFYWLGFPVWLFYFCLGMFHASRPHTGRINTSESVLLAAWIFSFAILLLEGRASGLYASSIKPTVLVYTVASYCLFYKYFFPRNRDASPVVQWLSEQSFLIYLMHPLCLEVLTKPAKYLGYPELWSGTGGMIILYLCTLVTTVAAVHLLSYTPIAPYLGGVRRKREQ